MVRSAKKMDADEAIKRCGKLALGKEEKLKLIESMQSERFKDIRSLKFGWVEQEDERTGKLKEKKLMSMLPNGKVCFIDHSQSIEDVDPDTYYVCLVYEPEGQKVSFAKILFAEYEPKIFIPPSRLPTMVWRDDNGKVTQKLPHGNSYEERLVSAIKEFEMKGFEDIKIVFRKNMR